MFLRCYQKNFLNRLITFSNLNLANPFFIVRSLGSCSFDVADNCATNTNKIIMQNSKGSKTKSYEDALHSLNGLQSNATVIENMRTERGQRQRESLPEMKKYLNRIDIQVSDIDQLNLIHVSGTKGKGTVTAYCESILRHSGLSTGLYSSPHLVEVRERIRINGAPLSKEKFAKYFFECFEKLASSASEHEGQMPGYFRFLTLMAFHVFLQEKVDAVVVEVGIGGAYDCTNIIRNPVVCGITMLELDHTPILGETIQEIAWHKAGIMKPGNPAVTLPQVAEATEVLFERCKELQASLHTVPALEIYTQDFSSAGLVNEQNVKNAALSMQLCRIWFYKRKKYAMQDDVLQMTNIDPLPKDGSTFLQPFHVPNSFIQGLRETKFYGRCQTVRRNNVTFYIDGAHTKNSIQACVNWFKSEQDKWLNVPREKIFRVLLFNLSWSYRDELIMLRSLADIDFDFAVFCPNILEEKPGEANADMTNYNRSDDDRLRSCKKNYASWVSIQSDRSKSSSLRPSNNAAIFPDIGSAICWIVNGKDPAIDRPSNCGPPHNEKHLQSVHIQLLVTGSFHLVGGVLKFLGPDICELKY